MQSLSCLPYRGTLADTHTRTCTHTPTHTHPHTHTHTHLSYDLLELGGDDLPLLMFGGGGTLTIPLSQLIHSLYVEEGLETIDVVIYQSEVLVVDCTAHLGGGAECHVLVM